MRGPIRRVVPARPKPAAAPPRANSAERAFRELRELIVKGHLAPGSWIVEADIADRLGLSRTPIRAALQWLHRDGYVVEHKGVRKTRILVAPLTKEDARELYAIVGHLEVLAGTQAAALGLTARAKLAQRLRALNAQLNEIASRRPVDPRRVFDIDKEFHATLVSAAAGPRLIALHQSVTPQVERYWRLYASSIINELHLSVSEHDGIISGIRDGDVPAIQEALQRNWGAGLDRLNSLIKLFGERGSW